MDQKKKAKILPQRTLKIESSRPSVNLIKPEVKEENLFEDQNQFAILAEIGSQTSDPQTEYEFKTSVPLFSIEKYEVDKEIAELIKIYFPKDDHSGTGYHFYIPDMIGKNPDYYENILLETNSVRIVHHYKNKSTLEISYSKLCIQKILSLKDWDKSPNASRRFQKSVIRPNYYNYWDYQKAWENVLLVQNCVLKHSWFIHFVCQAKIPNWFYSWWQVFGANWKNLPGDIQAHMEQEELNPQNSIDLLKYHNQTGIPWILQWDFQVEKRFPPHLKRDIYTKWWAKYDPRKILSGYKLPIYGKPREDSYETIKTNLIGEYTKRFPNLSQECIELKAYEHMFKMFRAEKAALPAPMATSSQGPGGTQGAQRMEDDSQRPEDGDSQTDNDSQGLENIPSDFPEDEFDPAEGSV